jgi:hypothetical protein
MTKILPIDTVIILYNKLGALTARNPERNLIIEYRVQLFIGHYKNMINCLPLEEQIIITHV